MDGPVAPSPVPSVESRERLLTLVRGYRISQAIYVVTRLGIPDLLADGPREVDGLAHATGSHPSSLRRVLRFLAAVGVLDKVGPDRLALTPVAAALRTGVPGSLRPTVLLLLDESHWRPWGHLFHTVRTGETAFDHVFGMGTFDYFARHPEAAAIFNEAMTEGTRWAAPAVIAAYDFARFQTIVDVGGGNGTLLAAILAATPGLRGTVFDLAMGVAGARRHLEAAGVADRCQVVEGDFFVQPLPSGADAYLLKSVIHDWDDERSVAILENCRRAMPAHGKLLLVEPVLPASVLRSEAHQRMVMSDLNMLAVAGGRERTEAEFRALLRSAGFGLTAVAPAAAPSIYSVIEGVPK